MPRIAASPRIALRLWRHGTGMAIDPLPGTIEGHVARPPGASAPFIRPDASTRATASGSDHALVGDHKRTALGHARPVGERSRHRAGGPHTRGLVNPAEYLYAAKVLAGPTLCYLDRLLLGCEGRCSAGPVAASTEFGAEERDSVRGPRRVALGLPEKPPLRAPGALSLRSTARRLTKETAATSTPSTGRASALASAAVSSNRITSAAVAGRCSVCALPRRELGADYPSTTASWDRSLWSSSQHTQRRAEICIYATLGLLAQRKPAYTGSTGGAHRFHVGYIGASRRASETPLVRPTAPGATGPTSAARNGIACNSPAALQHP